MFITNKFYKIKVNVKVAAIIKRWIVEHCFAQLTWKITWMVKLNRFIYFYYDLVMNLTETIQIRIKKRWFNMLLVHNEEKKQVFLNLINFSKL